MGDYENFLFLLGSVFVPLFGVLLGHWAAGGPLDAEPRFRPALVLVWLAGFVAYQWALPPEVFFPGVVGAAWSTASPARSSTTRSARHSRRSSSPSPGAWAVHPR